MKIITNSAVSSNRTVKRLQGAYTPLPTGIDAVVQYLRMQK